MWRRSGVIGVTPARDNPVQCDIHHALAALNIVCPMDEGAPGPDGAALTSAFPFDWAAFGFAHCAPGTLFRFPGPDSAQARSIASRHEVKTSASEASSRASQTAPQAASDADG